jgi:ribonuclease T1
MLRASFLHTAASARAAATKFATIAALATLCGTLAYSPLASSKTNAACALDQSIAVKDLPKQGRDTLALIESGGPFPHDRDGIAFSNRERILPKEKRGYYREYTVRTPGVKSRGAKRIVCGGDQRKADQCYFTDDHYKSFKCIAR